MVFAQAAGRGDRDHRLSAAAQLPHRPTHRDPPRVPAAGTVEWTGYQLPAERRCHDDDDAHRLVLDSARSRRLTEAAFTLHESRRTARSLLDTTGFTLHDWSCVQRAKLTRLYWPEQFNPVIPSVIWYCEQSNASQSRPTSYWHCCELGRLVLNTGIPVWDCSRCRSSLTRANTTRQMPVNADYSSVQRVSTGEL